MFRLLQSPTPRYFAGFMKKLARKSEAATPVDAMVKKFSHINPDNPKRAFQKTGRPWLATQLRLKSNEDLHKLYYVCLKQRNTILADQALRKRMEGRSGEHNGLRKLKVTVARLLTVLSEREKVRKEYRQSIEKEYVEKKKQELIEATKDLNDPDIPEVTWRLMKEKKRDLRKGIDNTDYIQRQLNYDNQRKALKSQIQENISKLPEKFDSFFQLQMDNKNYKPSQEEILKSHIKNWRMLSIKQRRIVLAFLNARRARDARTQFLKQLKLLGRKIRHDSKEQSTK